MNRFRLLIAYMLILLPLAGCDRENGGLKRLDFGAFRLDAPRNWRQFSRQGYDSQVGGITNGKDSFDYDYGWYSYRFNDETPATHDFINTTIDGRPALIVQPKRLGKGVMGMYIQVDSLHRLTLYGRNITNEAVAMGIFQSVRF